MPLELADAIAPPEGVGQGLPLDAQFRPAAPGHAHHAAPRPHPRRRDGRQGRARHRLSAQRLREARRGSRLQPVRHHRRSDELHLAGRQRDRLASRRREAAGHRADAALQVHPHHLRRVDAHPRPPALRAAPRRSTSAASPRFSTPSTRREKIYDICETASGPALPSELHCASAACCATSTTTWIAHGPRLRQGVPQGPRRHGAAAQPQPHLHRPHQGHRRSVEGGGDQPAAAPARSPGPAAWSATCARTSRTWPTRTSISRWSAPTAAIAWPATWCAWRRCWRA